MVPFVLVHAHCGGVSYHSLSVQLLRFFRRRVEGVDEIFLTRVTRFHVLWPWCVQRRSQGGEGCPFKRTLRVMSVDLSCQAFVGERGVSERSSG